MTYIYRTLDICPHTLLVRCICSLMLVCGAGLGTSLPAFAQDESEIPEDSLITEEWNLNLITSLSASQAAYQNWQEGGLNTLAFTSSIDGLATKRLNRWIQIYDARFALGFIRQEDQDPDFRKATDVIRLRGNLLYRGNGFFRTFNPTIAARLRTQFAKGFDYEEDDPELTSEFFAPAFITESIGLTYEPALWINTRLGLAGKETIVLNDELRTLYGLDPDQQVRFETGIESVTNVDRTLATNVRLLSTLSVFTAFEQFDELPDVTWENVVVMKVNEWLSTQLEFVTLYDKDTIDALQIKEVLSVGISFVLL